MGKASFLSLILIFLFVSCGSVECERWVREHAPYEEYNGTIQKKFLNMEDKGTKAILINDTIHELYGYKHLYDFLSTGDSVVKLKGTLRYMVIRNGIKYQFYPDCGTNFTFKDDK